MKGNWYSMRYKVLASSYLGYWYIINYSVEYFAYLHMNILD